MIERLTVQQPDNGIRASAFRAAAVWDCWAFVRGVMGMPIEAYTLALGAFDAIDTTPGPGATLP
jgi:hypothetical protein